ERTIDVEAGDPDELLAASVDLLSEFGEETIGAGILLGHPVEAGEVELSGCELLPFFQRGVHVPFTGGEAVCPFIEIEWTVVEVAPIGLAGHRHGQSEIDLAAAHWQA